MPMFLSPAAERVVAAQRAVLETSHRLGLAALDGTAKLYRLQFQATQNWMAAGKQGAGATGVGTESGDAPAASAPASAMHTAADGVAAMPALVGPAVPLLLKEMMEIVAATGGEVARIMAEQGTALRSTLTQTAGDPATGVAQPLASGQIASEQATASTLAPAGANMPVAPLPPSATASAVASAFAAPTPEAGQH